MKIMYRKYDNEEYEEISLDELKRRSTDEYLWHTVMATPIIQFDNLEKNTLYLTEIDAFDFE